MIGRRLATSSALTLAVLSALLLIAARPAQAQETVLYNFCSEAGCADGSRVVNLGGLTSYGGNLYGMTEYGGAFGAGTVFELAPNGSGGWNESVLYSFAGGADGSYGYSSVIFDSEGNLYGTTYNGGTNGAGVVFELSPVGDNWTETVLYNFCSQAGCADGENPVTNLIMDTAGNLYGDTLLGGPAGYGTVFELSPSDSGWTEQVLYSPGSTSSYGMGAGLYMDAAGNLYGATFTTVLELSPNGNDVWTPTVLHTFTGAPKDGYYASSTPVFDKAGNLYGVTGWGGAHTSCQDGLGCGTVYKLTPVTKGKKKGTWTEKILYSFKGGTKDGYEPLGVVLDGAGNIYGGTYSGGKSGDGIVYELVAPVGKGSYKEKVLWSFDGTDGAVAYGNLILDSAGNLYGATGNGGSSNEGVVFEVNPSAAVTTITLSSSPNPSTYGEAVTFTAAVTSSAGAPPDGETVSFMKGTTVLGTGALSGGSASFMTSALKMGTTSVTAVYGGDLNFGGSKSNVVKQVVEK